jgi:hypothetical protein
VTELKPDWRRETHPVYFWILFPHVLAEFAYVTAHGAAANVAFKLRGETGRKHFGLLFNLTAAICDMELKIKRQNTFARDIY